MTDSIRVFILSGGKGTRLKTVVSDLPKPMADISGKPFLEYLVQRVLRQGFSKITLLTGYKSEVIEEHFKDYPEIDVCKEEEALGTGGALRNAIDNYTEDKLLMLNGDTLTTLNLWELVEKAEESDAIALQFMEVCDRYGTVEVSPENDVLSFSEKFPGIVDSYINAGVYFLNRKTVSGKIPAGKFVSIEKEIFPRIKLKGIKFNANFIDIGIPEDYRSAQELIPKWESENES
ncbi:MAG: NTP transferase domain-containing protein [Bacteriovoracaceae bacterium]|nr:NTP transferase domain-containing protein [Bacteriovoracaceae bacterium]